MPIIYHCILNHKQMEDFGNKGRLVSKIEFLTATIILTMFILSIISDFEGDVATAHFNFGNPVIRYSTFGITLYLGFILLNFFVVPRLLRKESVVVNIL